MASERAAERVNERSELAASVHGDTLWVRIGESLIVGNRARLMAVTAGVPGPRIRTVVVDFLNTGYLDSSGLGALFAIHKRLRRNGGRLVVQNADADLRTLFELVQLDREFVVLEDPLLPRKCELIVAGFAGISNELVEHFAMYPDRLAAELDWRGFELLIDAIFRNHGFRTILGSGRADGGIDMRLVQSDICGDLVTIVQVRKYDKHRPIRLEAVQALCAVLDDQKANRGLFVTTSRYLPSARRFAERQGHRLTLCDSADVARWCADLTSRRVR